MQRQCAAFHRNSDRLSAISPSRERAAFFSIPGCQRGYKPSPDVPMLFTQYESLLACRRKYIELLEDNSSAANIAGPLRQWAVLLHFFAIAFHHYYLCNPRFMLMCRENTELSAFIKSLGAEAMFTIQSILESDVEYPRRFTKYVGLLDKFTPHAPPDKLPSNDQKKTTALVSNIEAAVQTCTAAKIDGVPETINHERHKYEIDMAPSAD
jgi:hypothetical protein